MCIFSGTTLPNDLLLDGDVSAFNLTLSLNSTVANQTFSALFETADSSKWGLRVKLVMKNGLYHPITVILKQMHLSINLSKRCVQCLSKLCPPYATVFRGYIGIFTVFRGYIGIFTVFRGYIGIFTVFRGYIGIFTVLGGI